MTILQTAAWLRSQWFLVLSIILLPPLGFVLLWVRPRTPLVPRLLGTLALLGFTVAHLVLLFDLRMELDGTGVRPIFSFGTREEQYENLEQNRQTVAQSPAAAPADEPVVAVAFPAPPVRPTAVSYWTDFRGPNRDGVYRQTPIATVWPAKGLPQLWRQPVGGGYASFVIAGGKAFTIEQRRNQEVVAAYDLETGRELWTNSWDAEFRESMGGDGPRATPTWQGGRLYALGAEGEFRCLEAASGKTLWRRNILSDNNAQNLTWGMSASPLIVDDKVIVLPGGSPGKSVVAYDRLTGEPVWKVLDDKQAYVSPMLVNLGGRRQILVVSALRVVGLDPSGKMLWEYPWTTSYDVNSAQPIVIGESRFFISSAYGHGAAVVELVPGNGRFSARTVWQNIRMKNKFNSSVLHEGHIYGLDENILACVDAETGDQKLKGGRYGYGQLLLADGHLIVITESGDLVLVKATPERHTELASFSALDGKTWNVPAMADAKLLVRNTKEMACFQIRPK